MSFIEIIFSNTPMRSSLSRPSSSRLFNWFPSHLDRHVTVGKQLIPHRRKFDASTRRSTHRWSTISALYTGDWISDFPRLGAARTTYCLPPQSRSLARHNHSITRLPLTLPHQCDLDHLGSLFSRDPSINPPAFLISLP